MNSLILVGEDLHNSVGYGTSLPGAGTVHRINSGNAWARGKRPCDDIGFAISGVVKMHQARRRQ
jgi:hypothetical protein